MAPAIGPGESGAHGRGVRRDEPDRVVQQFRDHRCAWHGRRHRNPPRRYAELRQHQWNLDRRTHDRGGRRPPRRTEPHHAGRCDRRPPQAARPVRHRRNRDAPRRRLRSGVVLAGDGGAAGRRQRSLTGRKPPDAARRRRQCAVRRRISNRQRHGPALEYAGRPGRHARLPGVPRRVVVRLRQGGHRVCLVPAGEFHRPRRRTVPSQARHQPRWLHPR